MNISEFVIGRIYTPTQNIGDAKNPDLIAGNPYTCLMIDPFFVFSFFDGHGFHPKAFEHNMGRHHSMVPYIESCTISRLNKLLKRCAERNETGRAISFAEIAVLEAINIVREEEAKK